MVLAADPLPVGPGADLLYAKCQLCHSLSYPLAKAGLSKAAWADIVDTMIERGAPINEQEQTIIIQYLGTYLGPNPPSKESASAEQKPSALDGASAYTANCSGCHRPQGQGVPGAIPALAGGYDLARDPTYAARVVLFGLQGKIMVNGVEYDGAMPALGHLDDQAVAAIVNYVLQTFNKELLPKDVQPLDAGSVAELRKEALQAKQVFEYRRKLLETK